MLRVAAGEARLNEGRTKADSHGIIWHPQDTSRCALDAGKEAVLAEYPMGKRMVPGPEARSGRRDLTGLMQPCGDPYAEHRALDDAWLHSTWTEGAHTPG